MNKTNDGVKYLITTIDSSGRNHNATINSLGCGLIDYSVDDLNVVFGIEDESKDWFTDIFSGISVFPWPNRLEDGKYTFEGVEYTSPINEIDKMTQLHSFSQFYEFSLVEQGNDSVTLGLELPATLSYPFNVYTEVTYEFVEVNGIVRLITKVNAKNIGEKDAPWGFCLHPWFNIRGDYEKASLQVDANKYIEIDERCLPAGSKEKCEVPVTGKFDMLEPRNFTGGADFDHAFIDLNYDQGYANCVLNAADGHITKVGAAAPYMSFQICTLQAKNRNGISNTVALEPSTCYANAFKTGDNLIVIKPNESFTADSFIEFL